MIDKKLLCLLLSLSLGHILGNTSKTHEISIAKEKIKKYDPINQPNLDPKEILDPAIITFRKNGLWLEVIKCYNLYSFYYDQVRDHNKRVWYLNESINIIRKHSLDSGDVPNPIGECFRHKAETLIAFGKLDSARVYLNKSYEISNKNLNWHELATIHVLKAVTEYYQKNHENMESELHAALKISEKQLSPSNPLAPTILQLLGVLYHTNGDHEKALKIAQKSVKALLKSELRNVSDSVNLCDKYQNIGAMYYNKEAFDQAILYYTKALNIHSKLSNKNSINISRLHNNLGLAYIVKREFQKSLFHLQLSHKKNKFPKGMRETEDFISCCQKLAELYISLGKLDSAIHFLKNAEEIGMVNKYKLETTFLNLGLANQKKRNNIKALDFLQKSIRVSSQILGLKSKRTGKSLKFLGRFYLENNQPELALEQFQASLIAYSKEFNEENIEFNPQAKNNSDRIHFLPSLTFKGLALLKLYHQDKDQKNLNLAYKTFKTATEFIDSIKLNFTTAESKMDLAEKRRIVYDGAIETCFLLHKETKESKYLEEAFYFLKKAKVLYW